MNTFQEQALKDFIEKHKKEFYEGLPESVLHNFSMRAHDMRIDEAARLLWCFFPCTVTLYDAIITPALIENEIRCIEDEIADSVQNSNSERS